MRICLIYNFAQHYRASIFQLISQEFNCDFVFGKSMDDVKKLDYSILKGNITETPTIHWGKWYYQKNVVSLIFKNYDKYILLGETRALSTWLFLILAKLFPRKKVYLWSHGWYGKETSLERIIKKTLFNLPNGGIFLYGNYAKSLMLAEGFDEKKLYVIHNSLAYEQQLEIRKNINNSDIYKKHFNNSQPNLLFIGRLTKVKCLDMLIDVIHILNTKGYCYNLTFVGDGKEKIHLEELAHCKNLDSQVWFYGSCYNERESAELIYNADLCISPGNVGLTAIHSMMFGTPVLTHDNFPYQMPEFEAINEGKTGMFFQQGNIISLTESIKYWIENHTDRALTRQECYKEIDERWTPQYQINVLKKIIS